MSFPGKLSFSIGKSRRERKIHALRAQLVWLPDPWDGRIKRRRIHVVTKRVCKPAEMGAMGDLVVYLEAKHRGPSRANARRVTCRNCQRVLKSDGVLK